MSGEIIMIKLNNKGNVSIILCALFTALLGFTACVTDIGLVYVEKAKLTNALDSAALAAVLELPGNSEKAREIANDYLVKNEIDPENTEIIIATDKRSIQIKGAKNVKHFFAPIININSSDVNSTVKAIVGPSKSVNGGIRPFAVEKFDYTYGSSVTLKEAAGDGYRGNYGAVAFGGSGSDVFRNNALYGYFETISVGDYIYTETGNMAGAANDIKSYINSENSSFDNYQRDSIRLWTIPLVDNLEVDGRGRIQVVGFGKFYVEEIIKNSGKIEITGRFIQYVTNSIIDLNLDDTGVYGAKLVNN